MDEVTLLTAIERSGGRDIPEAEFKTLMSKLDCLEQKGRYDQLLKTIGSSNDKNNFLASVLEATFAYQFETVGLELDYEVRQDQGTDSSIDFRRKMMGGVTIYFEVRLLQRDKATTDSIEEQLQTAGCYRVGKDGEDEKGEIIHLQAAMLSKVQKKDGTPIKFLSGGAGIINVVVVDVSQIMLGAVDLFDCLLATCGDPAVEEVFRRGIFGLFQEPKQEYPEHIHMLAQSYAHIRNTLHGILFLFKRPRSPKLDYSLEQYAVWNCKLIDIGFAKTIEGEIALAIPVRIRADD